MCDHWETMKRPNLQIVVTEKKKKNFMPKE